MVYDTLASKLVEQTEKLRLGDGLEDSTDVGPVVNRPALEKIHSYTEVGKEEGATLLTGGEIATENGLDRGSFYRPTIFGDVEPGMRIAQEEIFGPTTALIRATDVDEAIRIANGIEFGLSSSIFTRDVNKAFTAMRDLNAGITYINAGTTGAEVHLPFGGTRNRQRPPRGGPSGARFLHRVEVDLRRLRQASARADRLAMNRKLVVFVPREALADVRDALFAAGAGRLGDYERCSWYTAGTGTFLGGETTTVPGRGGA